jgi:FkbM family methyltransferase
MTKEFKLGLLDKDLFKITSENYFQNIIGKEVIIWGASDKGDLIYKLFQEYSNEHRILYYADNNQARLGEVKNGRKIISPNNVKEMALENESLLIIIGTENLTIKKQLLSYGIKEQNIDVKVLGIAKDYFNFSENTPFNIIKDNYNAYENVYNNLEDSLSKQIYLGILNMKISLDNKYIEGLASPEDEQYFAKDLIRIIENEVFVDCGSFNGDTLNSFLENAYENYSEYIAFEADKSIFNELNKKIVEEDLKNITTYNLACWDKEEILKFQSGGTSGSVSFNGDIEVQANSLDNILKDSQVTFIKMDIEGAEVNALLGAEKLIKNNQSILAICLYHDLEDYHKIPNLIKKFNPDYKIFIRHYRDLFDIETVCYAIPNSRLL